MIILHHVTAHQVIEQVKIGSIIVESSLVFSQSTAIFDNIGIKTPYGSSSRPADRDGYKELPLARLQEWCPQARSGV